MASTANRTELAILKPLWAAGRLSAREVHDAVTGETGWSYSTTRTVLTRMEEMSQRYGLRVANVFHAGDGNLHPLILYDANKPGELETAEAFGAEILKLCVAVGGVLTGEHGVGVEKRDLMHTMFDETDLAQQERLKCAFDEEALLNPGKMFPVLHRCAELGRVHVHGGQTRFPDLPRF